MIEANGDEMGLYSAASERLFQIEFGEVIYSRPVWVMLNSLTLFKVQLHMISWATGRDDLPYWDTDS